MFTPYGHMEGDMFTVETSMCMGIILIALMQFMITSFHVEQNISKYIDKDVSRYESTYTKENKKDILKDYVPSELKKCITIIENIGGKKDE